MTRQTVELASVSHDPASHSHALVCGIWTFSSTEYPLSEHTWMSGAKLTVKLAVLIALLLVFPAPVAVVSLRVSLYPLCVSCRIPQVTSSTPLESLFCQSPSERKPKYFFYNVRVHGKAEATRVHIQYIWLPETNLII